MAEDMEQQVNAIFAHQGKVICGECSYYHARGARQCWHPHAEHVTLTWHGEETTYDHPPVAISTMTVRIFGWRPWGSDREKPCGAGRAHRTDSWGGLRPLLPGMLAVLREPMTTTQPRTRRWYTWRDLLALSILLALIGSTHWLTFNISPSVPVGLYRFVPIEGLVHRGDLLHLPAVRFGHSWFYRRLIPLLKPVAAVPGEEVCVQPEGLWVQGKPYGVVYTEHRGGPIPVFWGCHVVGVGEVFVASHEDRSLDGRYFGMTRVEDARRVVPLWTWR